MDTTNTSVPICSKCASWVEGICNCEYSPFAQGFREADAPACAEYMSAQKLAEQNHGNYMWEWITHHVKAAVAIAVIVIVVVGAWLVTGDIWAAIILLEILLEIFGEF